MKVCGGRSLPCHPCSSWVGSYVAKYDWALNPEAYSEVELDWGFDSWGLDFENLGAFAWEQRWALKIQWGAEAYYQPQELHYQKSLLGHCWS